MIRSVSPRRFQAASVGAALSLSLSLLAGCATPVVPAPATTAPDGAPAAAAPAPATPAGEAAAPVMPAPAAVTATTLEGVATFRGQPVSGYAVTVLDARTGEPVALQNDLTGASGLAVLNKNLTTDAQGRFSLQVAGLTAGQSLIVQAKSGEAVIEAVVTSNLQSLGAKGYRVSEVGTGLTVSELTTAIARAARGVLRTTRLLSPEAAAPLLAKLATQMATLSAKLEVAIAASPASANALVGKDGDASLLSLVRNANLIKDLTANVAALVAEVAKSAGDNGKTDAAIKANLASIQFAGTVLRGSFDEKGLKLTNNLNGRDVDAASGDLGNVTTQTNTNSGGSSGPSFEGTQVANAAELAAALADTSVTAIALTADITLTAPPPPPPPPGPGTSDPCVLFPTMPGCPGYILPGGIGGVGATYKVLSESLPSSLTIARAITINGYNHSLTAYGDTVVSVAGVTIKNLTTNRAISTPYFAQVGTVTVDHVTFNHEEDANSGISMYYNNGAVINACTFNGGGEGVLFTSGTVTNCTFNSQDGRAIRYKAPSTITGNTIHLTGGANGVQFESSELNGVAAIADVKNNTFTWDGSGEAPFAYYFQQPVSTTQLGDDLKAALTSLASGNKFGTLATGNTVFSYIYVPSD